MFTPLQATWVQVEVNNLRMPNQEDAPAAEDQIASAMWGTRQNPSRALLLQLDDDFPSSHPDTADDDDGGDITSVTLCSLAKPFTGTCPANICSDTKT